jgi:hypothetical protein
MTLIPTAPQGPASLPPVVPPVMLAVVILGLSGCSQPAAVPARQSPQASADGHDHPHGGDHGHGHAAGDHEHGAGPHGGTLADWGGGKYHVEFTVDHDAKEAVDPVGPWPGVSGIGVGRSLQRHRDDTIKVPPWRFRDADDPDAEEHSRRCV